MGWLAGQAPVFKWGRTVTEILRGTLESGTSQWLMINAVAVPIRLSLKGGIGQGLKLMANAAAPPI